MGTKENKYLRDIGISFPSTQDELNSYDKIHEGEVYELHEEALNPIKILKDVKASERSKKKDLNKSQSYFRRAVLAAKIAHEYHNEWAFGAVKFQKLVYLCEQTSEMKFVADYRKQAAGPMNHKFIHSIKKEFEKQGWFKVEQVGEYRKWVFSPLENMLGYEEYYTNYYGNVSSEIQFLIDTFRKWKSERVELVATLYSCIIEAKKEQSIISDQLLIQKIYGWNKSKRKFSESEIISEIRWMEENGVYPG